MVGTSARPESAPGGPGVSVHGITKRFPGVLAIDHIDFEVRLGEVHALLGENGAGKSTLSNIIAGLYRPDEGVMQVFGREVGFQSPREALDSGIGMVHQHFKLVPALTVAENVVLGHENAGRFFHLRKRDIFSRVAALSREHNLAVDPAARVWQLSVGEQQRVELLKALYRDVRILILDEPTAVLTPQEAETLFETIRGMADSGRAIIFISHKLDEVVAVADRITVLRDGRNIATVRARDTDTLSLARMMVGRDIPPASKPLASVVPDDSAVIIELAGIDADGDRGSPALHGISLTVREGEIVGIAGVAGNGQRELAEVIAGLRTPTSGMVSIRGHDLVARTPQEAIAQGVAYVPDDRLGTGLAPNVTVAENLVLKSYSQSPFSSGPFLRHRTVDSHGRDLVERFDIRGSRHDAPVRLLSGGNIQKVLLAREISSKPTALIAGSPTRGLDFGAIQSVRSLLIDIATSGVAILLISEDLDEIFALSDRIGVLHGGRLMGMATTGATTVEEIGLWMAGVSG
jgi:ABC-type uncharacterized transport system ATPase subunit